MNWNYIAGFFDGEGTVYISNSRARNLALSFSNTHKAVLEKIKKFIGCGGITMQKASGLSKCPCYFLRYQHHVTVLFIAENLVKRCIVKRNKLESIIKYITSRKWRTCPWKSGMMPRPIKIPTKKDLEALYWTEEKSTLDIAQRYEVTCGTISYYLHKFGIPVRTLREAAILRERKKHEAKMSKMRL